MSPAVYPARQQANGDGVTHHKPASSCNCNSAWLADPKSQLPPPSALTAAQVAIVKSTAPALKEHGVTITSLFYKSMLDAHPELRDIFSSTSQATGAQPRALAASVLAYATYIDDLPKLAGAVERIAHKHASLNIRPEQYGIVGHHLLEAIAAVMGAAATPEVVDAWSAAYAVLAGVLIGREAQMYASHAGWVGFRPFVVQRRVAETPAVTSFYLAPRDGAPLPPFLPGQYVSLQLPVPGEGILQSRQYSLSDAPRPEGDYYRVSVKREDGGIVSRLLHDTVREGDEVEVSHPHGEFFVAAPPAAGDADADAGAPLVLLSAGVGATPLMAMLESATRPPAAADEAAARSRRPGRISWIQAARSRELRPFAARVAQIQAANPAAVSCRVFLARAGPDDVDGRDYHFAGARMDLDRLDRDADLFVGHPRAGYYVCGPEPWMIDVRDKLEGMGVARERIHMELFATGDVQ